MSIDKRFVFGLLLFLVCIGIASATTIRINATTLRTFTNDTDINFTPMRAETTGNWYSVTSLENMITTRSSVPPNYTARYTNGITFNTSVIPAGATINGANVTGYSGGHTNDFGSVINVSLIEFHPVSYTSLSYGTDFAATNYTRYSANVSNSSFITLNATVVFNLTTAGLTYINRTGHTGFMMENGPIIDNVEPTWPGTGKAFDVTLRNTTYDSGNKIPRMYVNYTESAGAPVASFSANSTLGSTPMWVQFTDSSTNTPTLWAWYYSNATVGNTLFNTSQNPVQKLYTGLYNISLNVSNSYGYSWSNRTGYIVVSAGETTFYASYDGYSVRYLNGSWNAMRNGASGTSVSTTGTTLYQELDSYSLSQEWVYNTRPEITWDTSALGVNATVTGAYIMVDAGGSYAVAPWGPLSYAVINATPTDRSSFVVGDYGKTKFVVLSDNISGSSFATPNATVSWTLNSAGWGLINKTGLTTFMIESTNMIDNTSPSWSPSAENTISMRSLEYDGGSRKPRLVVQYTTSDTGIEPSANFVANTTSCSAPCGVQFTDTSSNTPTSWAWEYTNGTGGYSAFTTPTTQNPAQLFTYPGVYTIHLTATNFYGSGSLYQTNYITVSQQSLFAPIAHFLMQIVNYRIPNPADSVYLSNYGTCAAQGTCVVNDPTGSLDQTARVQAGFNYAYVNGNSTVVFPASANITVASFRFLQNKTYLGNGSTLMMKTGVNPTGVPYTWIYSNTSTVINGFIFNGNRFSTGNGLNTNGVMLQGNNTFVNNTITRVNSYSLFTYYYTTPATNVLIANNTITNSKQYGIETGCSDGTYCYSSGIRVLNNTISGCAEVGIKIRGTTNATIADNVITVGATLGSEPSGIRLYSDDEQNTNVTIFRNAITGLNENPSIGIDSDNSDNYQISIRNNTVSNVHDGIIIRFDNGVISNNTIWDYTTCLTNSGSGNILAGNTCV